MAYNEETQRYDQYPRSQFPGNIDDWDNMTNVTNNLRPIVAQYQQFYTDNDIDGCNNLLRQYPDLDKCLYNADKINRLMDGVKATQQFFKDEVQSYVHKLGNATIGINDNPTTEEELVSNSYSAAKVNELVHEINTTITHIHTFREITLLSSNWSNQYPYCQTVAVDGITSDSNIKVIGAMHADGNTYEQDKAIDKAVGLLMYVGDGVVDGAITFKAKKLPEIDFTVIIEGG